MAELREPNPSDCKTWRDKARFVIGDAYSYWANCYGEKPSPKMPDEQKEKFIKYLRKHYPFGARRHFPYKVWLQEVRKVKDWLDGKPLKRHRSRMEFTDGRLFAEPTTGTERG